MADLPRFLQDHRFRLPRLWSNDVLRKLGPLFEGDMINVSGWLDEDKQGGHYRDYFPNVRRYDVSNYGGERGEGVPGEVRLDLEADLPQTLHQAYDVVLNHTTLEHVFDVFAATRNLCAMSRDTVVVVVPFLQEQHTTESFSDFWRFTPLGLERLFRHHGLEPVLTTSNHGRGEAIYHLCVATRSPERWRQRLAGTPWDPANGGRNSFDLTLREGMGKLARRFIKSK
ncbi:hypothetical protein [uncultured Devosia sp.]|uniref:hypothetical protein n=1 Tax=uncultured Devosia sp. TaxID=211434 RepID=UPI0026148AAA|nr:hypothetical protein [uncultured Devosia sp.]